MRSLAVGAGEHSRVSAVAPQKIFKKAVQRTKLRRQIYEAIQPMYEEIRSGTHAVLFAKEGTATTDFEDLKRETRAIFVKAGLLK